MLSAVIKCDTICKSFVFRRGRAYSASDAAECRLTCYIRICVAVAFGSPTNLSIFVPSNFTHLWLRECLWHFWLEYFIVNCPPLVSSRCRKKKFQNRKLFKWKSIPCLLFHRAGIIHAARVAWNENRTKVSGSENWLWMPINASMKILSQIDQLYSHERFSFYLSQIESFRIFHIYQIKSLQRKHNHFFHLFHFLSRQNDTFLKTVYRNNFSFQSREQKISLPVHFSCCWFNENLTVVD